MKTSLAIPTLFALALAVASAENARAQPADTSTPAAAATTKKPIPPGFEPIAGKEAQAESVSAPLLVVLAYGAFFLLTFGYVVHLARRQKALSDEVAALRQKLGKGGSGA
jgi:CcmD family protein